MKFHTGKEENCQPEHRFRNGKARLLRPYVAMPAKEAVRITMKCISYFSSEILADLLGTFCILLTDISKLKCL